MNTNIPRITTEFDSFIKQYSGYTAFVNELKERYSVDEKLYLAKVMQIQRNELNFSIDDIVGSIDNNITKELVRYTYIGNNVTLFENKESYSSDGLIVTSTEDEIITTSDADNKILLNSGEDKLISGKGNNTFYIRKGDGLDTVYDKGKVA